jgi:hypothetical protein
MSAMQAALGASGRPWSLFAFAHACFLPVHSLGSGPLLLIWSAGGIGVVELVGARSRCTRTVSWPEKKVQV